MSSPDAWGYKILPLKSGREWRVVEDYTYERKLIRITVQKGFVYDGASIPRIFWRFIGPPMAGKYAHATLLHDDLYENKFVYYLGKKVSISRRWADDFMLIVMKDDGVDRWRRNAIHRGVRLGGRQKWRT